MIFVGDDWAKDHHDVYVMVVQLGDDAHGRPGLSFGRRFQSSHYTAGFMLLTGSWLEAMPLSLCAKGFADVRCSNRQPSEVRTASPVNSPLQFLSRTAAYRR